MMVSQFLSDNYDIDDHLTGEDTTSKPEIEYYFDGTLHKRWQEELSKTHRKVLIFSPYIKGETAMILDEILNKEESEIYIQFKEENFINGASSITNLLQLYSAGLRNIYNLPNLHAKLILIRDVFVSIGSQNITDQGTFNKEANIVITDPSEISKIEYLVKNWTQKKRLIAYEEMSILRDKVIIYLKDHKINTRDLDDNSDSGNNWIPPKSPLRTSLEYVQARVSYLGKRYTLVPCQREHKFLTLELDQKTPLQSQGETLLRYLCYNRKKGTFGWVRLGKTRITFIETSLHRTEDKFIFKDYNNGWKFTLNFEFNKTIENNLKIVLNIYKVNRPINSLFSQLGSLTISCTFSEKGIKEWYYCEHQETKLQEQVKEYIDNYQHYYSETFASKVIDAITTPFRYDKALIGVEADSFFGEVKTKYKLRLGNINQQYIVVAE